MRRGRFAAPDVCRDEPAAHVRAALRAEVLTARSVTSPGRPGPASSGSATDPRCSGPSTGRSMRWMMPMKMMSFVGSIQNQVPAMPSHRYVPLPPCCRAATDLRRSRSRGRSQGRVAAGNCRCRICRRLSHPARDSCASARPSSAQAAAGRRARRRLRASARSAGSRCPSNTVRRRPCGNPGSLLMFGSRGMGARPSALS